MKLRFFMSHCRKNSARDKVFGKKLIYLERSIFQRQIQSVSKGEKSFGMNVPETGRAWSIRGERPRNTVRLVLMGWIIS